MYAARQHKETMNRTYSSQAKRNEKQFVNLSMPHVLQTYIKPTNNDILQLYRTRKKIISTLDEINAEFVLKEDAKKISEYTKKQNCAISIRKTGAASLARLRQGAGTKPHAILDKSLKKKTAKIIAEGMNLNAKGNNILGNVLANLNLPLDMEGHVPHWDTKTTIDGFYITAKGEYFCRLHQIQPREATKSKAKYININDCRLITRTWTKKWHACFITGDYDVHDIVKYQKFNRKLRNRMGRKYPRTPKASDIERWGKHGDTGILKDLNELMGYLENQRRFQHGAQVNYKSFANMKNETIVSSLLRPDFPVALCDRGCWHIIKNDNQLRAWYKSTELAYPWPK